MPLVFLPVGVLETLAVFDSVNERSFPLDVLRPSCQINNEQRGEWRLCPFVTHVIWRHPPTWLALITFKPCTWAGVCLCLPVSSHLSYLLTQLKHGFIYFFKRSVVDSEEKTDDFHFVFTTQQQKEQDTNVSGLDGDHRCSRKRQVKQWVYRSFSRCDNVLVCWYLLQ